MKSCYLFFRWVLAVSFLSIASVNAAVFIKIGDIKGESQAAGHEEEIDVLSWSWGVTRPITSDDGSTRTRGNPEIQDLVISKVLEKSTPKLFEACIKGITLPEAVLVIEKPSGTGGDFKVLEITMTNVSITSDSLAGSVEVIENVTMNFEVVGMKYFVQNPDGSAGGTVEMSYDIEAGE